MDKIELLIGLTLSESDKEYSENEKLRNRRFGKSDEIKTLSDFDKIREWYNSKADKATQEKAQEYRKYISVFTGSAVALFFLIGIGAAIVLFKYDGSSPINIIPILVFFVIVPFLLFLSLILMNIVSRKRNKSNRKILDSWAFIFQKVLFFFYKKFPHENRIFADNLKNSLKKEFKKHNKLINIYLISLLQKTSLAYIIGALLWIFLMITISDLAFAWSSTLNIHATHIHSVTNTISTPWKSLLPNAVVDLDIIERTRYYRAYGTAIPEGSTAHDLGIWWSFLLMSIFTYSFFPRLVSFTYYNYLLKKTAGLSILNSPEGQELLDQMNRPHTSTKPESHPPNTFDIKTFGPTVVIDSPTNSPKRNTSIVYLWNINKEMISDNDLNKKINSEEILLFPIGGFNTPEDDKNVIEKSLKHVSHNISLKQIFVLVEYYESPNIDFLDIMTMLRNLMDKRLITIVPIIRDKDDLNDHNKENWLYRLNKLADPYVDISEELFINLDHEQNH